MLFYKPLSKKEFQHEMIKKNNSLIVGEKKDYNIESNNFSLPVDCQQIDLSIIDQECQTQQCLVCCERPSKAVLLPCGHGGICMKCSELIKKKSNKCHICRVKIEHVVEVKQNSTLAYVPSNK